MKKIILLLISLMPLYTFAASKLVPVAILSDNPDGKTKTLTFTYAQEDKVRGRSSITVLDEKRNYWPDYEEKITKIEFKKSFSSFIPEWSFCRWFGQNTPNVQEIIGLEYLDLSKAINTQQLFGGCKSLKRLSMPNKTLPSTAKDLIYMFEDCDSLEYVDLSNLNAPFVEDMRCMFYELKNLKEVNLSNAYVPQVKSLALPLNA